jgi:hypothetical protein
MTLEPTSAFYEEEYQADLTTLPGWKAATPETRERIVRAAGRYLLVGDPENDRWLPINTQTYSSLAGYKALVLLSQQDPTAFSRLDNAVWDKWAAIVLTYPDFGNDLAALKEQLLERAYRLAPVAFICAVWVRIDAENERSEHLMLVDKLRQIWDDRLADALYLKCRDHRLKPAFVRTLLDLLLEHGHEGAHSFAESLVSLPVPSDDRGRAMAVAAAAALLGRSDTGWQLVWPAIHANVDFGREVVSETHGALMLQQLSEGELADLYLWLHTAYPVGDHEVRTGWTWRRVDSEDLRNGILQHLQSRGTEQACEAIERLMHGLPKLGFLKWALYAARETTRQRSWKPTAPEHLLKLPRHAERRLVRGGEELLAVVVESLERYQARLRGETPLVANIWNQLPDDTWEPKDEEHLSDNIKQHLEDELRGKGIVLRGYPGRLRGFLRLFRALERWPLGFFVGQ